MWGEDREGEKEGRGEELVVVVVGGEVGGGGIAINHGL